MKKGLLLFLEWNRCFINGIFPYDYLFIKACWEKKNKKEVSHKSLVIKGNKYGKTALKAPVLLWEGGSHLPKDSAVWFSFFVMSGSVLSTPWQCALKVAIKTV